MRQTITFLAAAFLVLTLQAQTAGEMVFSDTPIAPDAPASLKTEFTVGEHIYAVAYLTDAVKNLYQNQSPNATLQVEVFIYEKKTSALQLSATRRGTAYFCQHVGNRHGEG